MRSMGSMRTEMERRRHRPTSISTHQHFETYNESGHDFPGVFPTSTHPHEASLQFYRHDPSETASPCHSPHGNVHLLSSHQHNPNHYWKNVNPRNNDFLLGSLKQNEGETADAQDTLCSPQKQPVQVKANKPKRPLSAYNIFFKEERHKILASLSYQSKKDEEVNINGANRTNSLESENVEGFVVDSANAKRTLHQKELPNSGGDSSVKGKTLEECIPPKRKRGRPRGPNYSKKEPPHRLISFSDLAKMIGTRWKSIDKSTRTPYKLLAKKELEQYQKKCVEFSLLKEKLTCALKKKETSGPPPSSAQAFSWNGINDMCTVPSRRDPVNYYDTGGNGSSYHTMSPCRYQIRHVANDQSHQNNNYFDNVNVPYNSNHEGDAGTYGHPQHLSHSGSNLIHQHTPLSYETYSGQSQVQNYYH